MTPEYLTAAEVGEIIRESADNVRRRCAANQIQAKKLGQEWRITPEAVALFMTPRPTGTPRKGRLTKRQRQQLGQAS